MSPGLRRSCSGHQTERIRHERLLAFALAVRDQVATKQVALLNHRGSRIWRPTQRFRKLPRMFPSDHIFKHSDAPAFVRPARSSLPSVASAYRQKAAPTHRGSSCSASSRPTQALWHRTLSDCSSSSSGTAMPTTSAGPRHPSAHVVLGYPPDRVAAGAPPVRHRRGMGVRSVHRVVMWHIR
ncbi:hypothetical protein OH77DRAFT_551016 [Trametes cingulata]|nr:hypothetical protein OH77DRAFT_551016 [Trametes cingulata]